MKKTWLLITCVAVLLVAVILIASSGSNTPSTPAENHQAHTSVQTPAPAANTMPAHYTEPPSRASLGPTLEPDKFTGPVREAYRVAREIPVTLAQLPCYCHCDRGMGHKSLFSCYTDDHAAHCATCVEEALLALKLEKEQKLSPAQIRDKIVEQFGQ